VTAVGLIAPSPPSIGGASPKMKTPARWMVWPALRWRNQARLHGSRAN